MQKTEQLILQITNNKVLTPWWLHRRSMPSRASSSSSPSSLVCSFLPIALTQPSFVKAQLITSARVLITKIRRSCRTFHSISNINHTLDAHFILMYVHFDKRTRNFHDCTKTFVNKSIICLSWKVVGLFDSS